MRKSPSLYVSNSSKHMGNKLTSKKISKNNISGGMLLSSTNPNLLSKSTDLLHDRCERY